jgi:hypothetical protein
MERPPANVAVRGEADCGARCVSCKSPNWVSPWNVGYRRTAVLSIVPEESHRKDTTQGL